VALFSKLSAVLRQPLELLLVVDGNVARHNSVFLEDQADERQVFPASPLDCDERRVEAAPNIACVLK